MKNIIEHHKKEWLQKKGKKMVDKRKTYVIVLDTETCPLDKDMEEVTPSNMFVYDVGMAVVDKKGNVYEYSNAGHKEKNMFTFRL